MATPAPGKQCGICHKDFDVDSRCPRILQCFHTLCTACADLLIRNNTKSCPFCDKDIGANTVRDVAVNHAALELIKYLTSTEAKLVQADSGSLLECHQYDPMESLKESCSDLFSRFQATQKQIESILQESEILQVRVQQENTRIESEALALLKTVVSHNKTKQEQLCKMSKIINNQLKEISYKIKELETAKVKVNAYEDHTFKEKGEVVMDVEKTVAVVEDWFLEFEKSLNTNAEIIQGVEKELIEAKGKIDVVLEVLNPHEEGDEDLDTATGSIDNISLEDLSCGHTSEASSKVKRNRITRLVNQGRVFAIRKLGGRRRAEKISIEEYQSLCPQYLDQVSLPSDIQVVDPEDAAADPEQNIEGFIII